LPGPVSADLRPAYIQAGRVVDVDPVHWTVTVRSEIGEQLFTNLPIAAVYLHSAEGEGVYVMPEVGAECWVARPSEKDRRPFILCYRPLTDQGEMADRGNRPPMNPGDIFLLGRDQNGIRIRRGGILEVFATPIARTMYLPTDNAVQTICEDFRVLAFGGTLNWDAARPEEDPDGKLRTTLDLRMKEYADDAGHVARLRVGRVDEEGDPVLKLQVFADGSVEEASLTEALSLVLNRQGEATLTSSNVRVQLSEGASVSVFNTEANVEGVVLGRTFLTDLLTFLTGLQTVFLGLGIIVPGLVDMISRTSASLSAGTAGGAPYLSTRSRTE